MRQITDGLTNLHQINIIHKNLNPDTIVVTRDADGSICAKISDTNLCIDKFSNDDLGIAVSIDDATEGYRAPELIFRSRSFSRDVSLFKFAT